jgi:poly-gamma-glutamate system protein
MMRMMERWGRGDDPRSLTRLFLAAACASLLAWGAAERWAPRETVEWTPEMRAAAERMAAALEVVGAHRKGGSAAGAPDPRADPNRTGLIGPEYAELFTTLGHLEAKRTTTNPDVAGLMAHLLAEAGVGAGDRVAVGASGSFPALLVATLTATEALGAEPVAVLSLGASSHGLTDPAFDLLHLHQLLLDEGVVRSPPAAASLGGARDAGEDFEPEVRGRLLERVRESGVPLILETDPARAVARRMEIWGGPTVGGATGQVPVAAFVNIGGADANVGTSPTILSLGPGLHAPEGIPLPPAAQRGALHATAEAGVPVIHLLDVGSLATRHGLPWDPVPLPAPASARLTRGGDGASPTLLVIAGLWLAAMAALAVAGWATVRLRTPSPRESTPGWPSRP